MTNELIRRATIEDVVNQRNLAISLYEDAYRSLEIASAAVDKANKAASDASPGVNGFNHSSADEVKAFRNAIRLPPRETYLRTARRLVDIDVWSWIIERTDLLRLMDKEAKDKLRSQMAYIPERTDHKGQLINGEEIERGIPPVTVENIMATLEQFQADSGMIFRRGIANVFSKLDRRFKSHDGFKVGSRMILRYAFNEYGSLNYGGIEDQLIDIERVFSVLDGVPEAQFTSGLYALRQQRSRYSGKRQSDLETTYFRIKGFKNGNAHLWFTRDDLVVKVNKLLAEYYGEVIGDGMQAEEDPFANVKTTPARFYGFYPTPDDAASRLIEKTPLLNRKEDPQLRILEPSAGTGNLARRCVKTSKGYDRWADQYRFDNKVDCVEIQPHLAAGLQAEGIYNRVICQDFLTLSPGSTGLYDRVVMNPPFDRERDIDHVMHAMKFLKDDGYLTAIMSAGTEFRETKKSVAFRALIESLNGSFTDMPSGSFSECGTNVNTVILRVWKNKRRPSW